MTAIITTIKIVTMIRATKTPAAIAPVFDSPVEGWVPPRG